MCDLFEQSQKLFDTKNLYEVFGLSKRATMSESNLKIFQFLRKTWLIYFVFFT